MTAQDKRESAAPGSSTDSKQHQTTTPDAGQIVQQQGGGKLELVICKNEPRIDSRLLAQHFGKAHHDLFELVKQYRADFEKFGVVRFQSEKPLHGTKGGRPVRFALLTEDQSYLLLTYTRNTAKARARKVKLVQAFGEARSAALPRYHALHQQIHALAAGTPNERFVHLNFNSLVNRTVGIESGQRASVNLAQQSLLTVAQAVAAQAMRAAPDHHAGFQQAKTALVELSRAALIEGTQNWGDSQ